MQNDIFTQWEEIYEDELKGYDLSPADIKKFRMFFYAGAMAMLNVHYEILSDESKTSSEIEVLMDAAEEEVTNFFEQHNKLIH